MAGDKQQAVKCQWSVVKLLLLVSHGQSTVNRGFFVNKEVAVENLSERSFMVTLNQLEALSITKSESNFLCHLLELDRIIFPKSRRVKRPRKNCFSERQQWMRSICLRKRNGN